MLPMDDWAVGSQDESRFGVDQWHFSEQDNLTELERWPEVNGTPGFWRVFLVDAGEDAPRFRYAQTDGSLSEEEAAKWAVEQRELFLGRK